MQRRTIVKTARLAIGWMLSMSWCGASHIAWARDDFQSWNSLELVKQLDAQWEIFLLPEIRIRDDASQLFYHEYRQGVRWKPSQHLQVGLNYLFVRNASSGTPREEHTGELDVTPKTTAGPFQLSLRGRVALRSVQGSAGEEEWQFRVMPKIAMPTRLIGHALTPYVADDLFYDGTRKAWNQNRVFLGVSVPVGQKHGVAVSVDVYYMLQSQLGKRHDWNSNHILGTKLSVRF